MTNRISVNKTATAICKIANEKNKNCDASEQLSLVELASIIKPNYDSASMIWSSADGIGFLKYLKHEGNAKNYFTPDVNKNIAKFLGCEIKDFLRNDLDTKSA